MVVIFDKLKTLGIGYMADPGLYTEKQPALVMIHGAGGCAQVWQNQIHFLNHSLNPLALDLPGHGKTDGQGLTSLEEYTHWLAKVIRTLFREPVFLMGHSMGGAIVQDMALMYPNLLSGIILAGTGPILKVAPVFLEGLKTGFEETINTIISYAYAKGTDISIINEGAKLMKQAGSSVVQKDFEACDRFDRRKDIVKINLPCLILCGDQDRLTPPSLSKSLSKSIKKSVLEIFPSTGHMVMIESHKAFNQRIRDFVLETPR